MQTQTFTFGLKELQWITRSSRHKRRSYSVGLAMGAIRLILVIPANDYRRFVAIAIKSGHPTDGEFMEVS